MKHEKTQLVYPKAGAPAHASPGGSITVANAKTYVHLNASREWVLVQDQATDEIAGASRSDVSTRR